MIMPPSIASARGQVRESGDCAADSCDSVLRSVPGVGPASRRALWLLVLVLALWGSSPAHADELDIGQHLRAQGVRLVVVEFYADWCPSCVEAAPRWEAVRKRYRDRGLRLVVVNQSGGEDAEGCVNPGWAPDAIVCDPAQVIAKRFNVRALPTALLWSWRGPLLVRSGHVDEVEGAIKAFLEDNPRILVEAGRADGRAVPKLRRQVEAALTRTGKVDVVADDETRKKLEKLRKDSHAPGRSDAQRCPLGEQSSANHLLTARLERGELSLRLTDAVRGCNIGYANAIWRPDAPEESVASAVNRLMSDLHEPPERRGQPQPEMPKPAVERAPEGTAFLRLEPRDATLTMNGRPVRVDTLRKHEHGRLLRLRAGERHILEASAPGRLSRREEVLLRPGDLVQVDLRLAERPPPPKACGTGRCVGDLLVQSRPPGAEVVVDGVRTGLTTHARADNPEVGAVLVANLDEGQHIVELSRLKYERLTTKVEVVRDRINEMPAATMTSTLGWLEVQSKPEGATVVLDGVSVGSTPLERYRVDAGPHRLEVQLQDHRVREELIAVAPGKTRRVAWTLTPAFGELTVRVRSGGGNVAGAEVRIDGRRVGTTDESGRLRAEMVASGLRSLDIGHPLYRTLIRELEMTDGAAQRVEVDLEANFGMLSIKSDVPTGADVLLDGLPVGSVPLRKLHVPAGPHELVVSPKRSDRYDAYTERFALVVGEHRRVDATLRPRMGTLVVSSVPIGARLQIDGEARGTTPTKLDLFVGRYEVEAVAKGHRAASRTVEVRDGERSHVELVLESNPTLEVRCEPEGSHVLIDEEYQGIAPGPIDLRPGSHTVHCRPEGVPGEQVVVELRRGEQRVVSIRVPVKSQRAAIQRENVERSLRKEEQRAAERRAADRRRLAKQAARHRPESSSRSVSVSASSPYKPPSVDFTGTFVPVGLALAGAGIDGNYGVIFPFQLGVILDGHWRVTAIADLLLIDNKLSPSSTEDNSVEDDMTFVGFFGAGAGYSVDLSSGKKKSHLSGFATVGVDLTLGYVYDSGRCTSWTSTAGDYSCAASDAKRHSFGIGGNVVLNYTMLSLGARFAYGIGVGVLGGLYLALGL